MTCSPSLRPVPTAPTQHGPPGASLEQQRPSPQMGRGGRSVQWRQGRHFTCVRHLLQDRLSLPSFIYNGCLLMAAGWGTASCCCLREGTQCQAVHSTTTSGRAVGLCLPEAVPPPPHRASCWNVHGIGMGHQRSLSPTQGHTEVG